VKLIDTHCHLTHGRLARQLPDVLARSKQAGVEAMICAAGNVQESKASLNLARAHAGVYCTAGVHPHDAKDVGDQYLKTLEELAADAKNVAVGEIGLDYHYDFSPREDQRRVFAAQLELAARLGKKIVIHTREAFDDTLAILSASNADPAKVVFHSFTGDASQAHRALELGAMLSFSGIATFARADDIRQSVAATPDDRILIETDAPYLSPEPVRKMKTNEPANVVHVAAALAVVRKATPQELAELTSANAERFFALGEACTS